MNPAHLLTAAAMTALGMAWIPSALAQAPATPPTAAQRPASPYSEDELKSFAIAALDVQRIRTAYLPKLGAATSPEEEQQVRTAATAEMVQAIQKHGMSVDKYTEIAQQAQASPEVAQRIQRHVDAAAGKCDTQAPSAPRAPCGLQVSSGRLFRNQPRNTCSLCQCRNSRDGR